MSFLTCFWLFPQKEHLRRSPPSPMRATDSLLVRRRRTLGCTRQAQPRGRLLLDDGRGHPRSRNAVCPLMADKRRRCHLNVVPVESGCVPSALPAFLRLRPAMIPSPTASTSPPTVKTSSPTSPIVTMPTALVHHGPASAAAARTAYLLMVRSVCAVAPHGAVLRPET